MHLKTLSLFIVFWVALTAPAQLFGWGEAGHQIVGKVAARLVAEHPTLLSAKGLPAGAVQSLGVRFFDARYKLGLMGTIPDVHWRNIPGEAGKIAESTGGPTHYLNVEKWLSGAIPGKSFLPLITEALPSKASALPSGAGSVPWRAAQFAALLRQSFETYPRGECGNFAADRPHPTAVVIQYAGILTHFLADSSQPYHTTSDYDGEQTGQKGLHAYFESDLVDALDPGLEEKVFSAGKKLLTLPAKHAGSVAALKVVAEKLNGAKESPEAALTLALVDESFTLIPEVRERDRKYALLPPKEAKERGQMRRNPKEFVNALGKGTGPKGGRTVAGWNESLIVERLAIAAALSTDVWVQTWQHSGTPTLCHTWDAILKPDFVSPN